MREDVIEMASDVLDLYNDIITECEENPKMWETIARDCLSDMPFDDLEVIAKEQAWPLPLLGNYLYHPDEIHTDVIKMCEKDPKMWENVLKACLKWFPSEFVKQLCEECNWLSVGYDE